MDGAAAADGAAQASSSPEASLPCALVTLLSAAAEAPAQAQQPGVGTAEQLQRLGDGAAAAALQPSEWMLDLASQLSLQVRGGMRGRVACALDCTLAGACVCEKGSGAPGLRVAGGAVPVPSGHIGCASGRGPPKQVGSRGWLGRATGRGGAVVPGAGVRENGKLPMLAASRTQRYVPVLLIRARFQCLHA